MITIEKPPHGAPCNGCGLCCLSEPCLIATSLFKQTSGPCPAVQPAGDGRWECAVMSTPGAFRLAETLRVGPETMTGAAAFLLGAGQGCDCREDGEEIDLLFEFEMSEDANSFEGATMGILAQMLWGMI